MSFLNKSIVSPLICLLFLLLSTRCNSSTTVDTVTVKISDGQILGSQFVSSWTNKTIYAFMGIPYASPPIGDLRFKPPVPPQKWNTTMDCTWFRSSCMQRWVSPCSEDCLFLNVYSPNVSAALLPVYIWMHGGAFISGAGSWYGPDKLVAEGVIVVTVNYRLGAFGFLTLGTTDTPGNAGAFDQILAMKWVQKEISKFGGDPNRVTLGGQSAGSMLTHLHYLSPSSKGLFHAVIGESGTSLKVVVSDKGTYYGLQLAKFVNCSNDDISITEQCLRNLSADNILDNQYLVTALPIDNIMSYIIPWVASVDKETNKENAFLPAPPTELIAQGQGSAVPFLMGTNIDEGEVMLFFGVNEQKIADFASMMQYLIPTEVVSVSSSISIQEKVEDIKREYFGGARPTMSTILGYLKLYGHFAFIHPTAKSAAMFRQRSSVYLYRFEFDGLFRQYVIERFDKQYNYSFVGHGDELGYLFVQSVSTNQSITDPNSREEITWSRMVKLWTNFIKYLKPTPSPDSLLQNVTWTPVQKNSLHYLEISDNLTMVQSDYEAQAVQFWDCISSMPSSGTILVAHLLLILSLLITSI